MDEQREAKSAARAFARILRGRAALGGDGAAEAIRLRVLAEVPIPRDAVVAGYWPMGTEADVRPLLLSLHQAGHTCALPVVAERGRPLSFRAWAPETKLVKAAFGVREPEATAPEVRPSVLLVPLLSFDRAGHRLGYGGGFYDRTIQALRTGGGALTVGVGFAAQEVTAVPRDDHDQVLDWIVTEAYALQPAIAGMPA
ncbi:MAG TPA: 5-formyltetrahydrofolate cyclo-ligase [Azospirillaceae bacterium]|nr:5-formyltetrahydrofolate cyclo-ligase [Azospirillaceae bacterium]